MSKLSLEKLPAVCSKYWVCRVVLLDVTHLELYGSFGTLISSSV